MPIGEERGRPDERLAELVTPLQVVRQRELQYVLALGGDRGRSVGGVRQIPLAGGEHRDGLEEVGVLDRREDRVGRPLELGLLPVVVQAEVLARLLVIVRRRPRRRRSASSKTFRGRPPMLTFSKTVATAAFSVLSSSTIAGML